MTFTLITVGDSLNLKWVGTPKHLLFLSHQKWQKSRAFLSATPRVVIVTYHSQSKDGPGSLWPTALPTHQSLLPLCNLQRTPQYS